LEVPCFSRGGIGTEQRSENLAMLSAVASKGDCEGMRGKKEEIGGEGWWGEGRQLYPKPTGFL